MIKSKVILSLLILGIFSFLLHSEHLTSSHSAAQPNLIKWIADQDKSIDFRLGFYEGIGTWTPATSSDKLSTSLGKEIEFEVNFQWKNGNEGQTAKCKRKAVLVDSEINIYDSWEGEGHDDAKICPEIVFKVPIDTEAQISALDGRFAGRPFDLKEWITNGFKSHANKTKFVGGKMKTIKLEKWNGLTVEIEFDEQRQIHFETQNSVSTNDDSMVLFKIRPYVSEDDVSWRFVPGSLHYKVRIKPEAS